MEFPYVCHDYVLLPLVHNKASLTYSRAEHSTGRKIKLNADRTKAESGRCHVITKEARCKISKHKP